MKLLSSLGLALLMHAGWAHASGIDALREFIQQTRSIKADFEQSVFDKDSKLLQQSRGSMQFLRPGKFRWFYQQPYEQLIVGDGVKLWIYDKDLNQVTVKKLDQAIGASPAALLAGDSEIENSFTLVDLGKRENLDWLEALPKSEEGTFEKMLIGFNGHSMARMELYDRFGHMTRIRFIRLEHNPKLLPGVFVFTPPAGADVIGE